MQTKDIKNFKMSDDVYKLRRKVINHIYELRHLRLPRVEVRIGEARHSRALLGQAALKDRKVWITKAAINMGERVLRNVVFHELVHVKQYLVGELSWRDKGMLWKGELYDVDYLTEQLETPYEIEAYGREKGLLVAFFMKWKEIEEVLGTEYALE